MSIEARDGRIGWSTVSAEAGQGDQLTLGGRANVPREFVAVHHRQSEIDDRDIGAKALDGRQGRFRIARDIDLMAGASQVLSQHREAVGVVVYEQNPCRGWCVAGHVMSITRALPESHVTALRGGEILRRCALPRPRRGVRCRLVFIVANADPQSACRSSRLLAHTRVLVVDDEDDARELLRHVLEGCGAEVLDASSVADALQTLDSFHVDAIVSDIGMPDRDGYSFIQAVRSAPRIAAIPAIAVTAFTGREDKARALGAGFDRHLGKPFDLERLLETLTGLVESSRSPGEAGI